MSRTEQFWSAGAVRRECMDRMLIFGRQHLRVMPAEFVHRYNTHRPRRALAEAAPCAPAPVAQQRTCPDRR